MSGKTSTDSKRKYNEKAYDRLAITVPKGQKVNIEQAANECGESVNLYVQRAILARMGRAEWPPTNDPDEE